METDMEPTKEQQVSIEGDRDVIQARQTVRAIAKDIGFSLTDQTRITTAVSELARNIAQYAGRGVVRIRSLEDRGRVGIEVRAEDQGPGISDVEQALEEGKSTGGGMGLGLSGAKRLMDEFEISSTPNVGTMVLIRKWRK